MPRPPASEAVLPFLAYPTMPPATRIRPYGIVKQKSCIFHQLGFGSKIERIREIGGLSSPDQERNLSEGGFSEKFSCEIWRGQWGAVVGTSLLLYFLVKSQNPKLYLQLPTTGAGW